METDGSRAPRNDLVSAFSGTDGLRNFDEFFQSLSLPPGLDYIPAVEESYLGRPTFLSKMSKPQWRTAELRRGDDGFWHLDPARHFNIHFEPQYQRLVGTLSFYLHYETNPYHPKKWAEQHINPMDYAAYLRVRSTFRDLLTQKPVEGFVVGGRTNQVGKAVYNFEGFRETEVRNHLRDFIRDATNAVDSVLEHLGLSKDVE